MFFFFWGGGGAFSGLIEIFLFSFLLSFENHLTPNYNYPQLNMYQQPYGRSVTEVCELNMRNKGYHIIQLGTKVVSYSGAV